MYGRKEGTKANKELLETYGKPSINGMVREQIMIFLRHVARVRARNVLTGRVSGANKRGRLGIK